MKYHCNRIELTKVQVKKFQSPKLKPPTGHICATQPQRGATSSPGCNPAQRAQRAAQAARQ